MRVIGSAGEQLGVITSREALESARSQGLDLVLVAASADPPVCKIIDYGKFKYQEGKLGKDKKSKQQEVKGIKISPRIAEHDLAHQIKRTIEFLEEGNKVRVVCLFKAREITHPELGTQRLMRLAEDVKEYGTIERPPALEGRQMIMVVLPKPSASGKQKNAKTQNVQNSSQAVQSDGDRKDSAAEVAQQSPVPSQEG